MTNLLEILKTYWGYDAFRPLQREAMAAVLANRDSLVVLPTGGGKSLCFQAPAMALDGLAIVVSPLIALMKDQVDALRECGVPAAAIYSGMSERERQAAWQGVRAGEMRLLYVAPERLVKPQFLAFLKELHLSFIAIDEAHCISQWGHDFRPEYRELNILREVFPGLAIHAYTATATPQVRDDIVAQLHLRDADIHIGSFNRPNLVYSVQRRTDRLAQVRAIIDRHPGDAGIVYCISRKDTTSLAEELNAAGFRAVPYHAGLGDAERHANQDDFIHERADIVVATVAFGMGIDKSNVRYVIHAGLPKSVEHYQQESGRAGRDGLEAECILLHSAQDFMTWRWIIEKGESDGAEIALKKLNDMTRYCEAMSCRRKYLLGYFHETYSESNCGACDVCLDSAETAANSGSLAKTIIAAIVDTGQRFGGAYVVKILRGESDERVERLNHSASVAFGAMKGQATGAIHAWIGQLVEQGFIERVGEYNVLQLTRAGRAYLNGDGGEAPRLSDSSRPVRAARKGKPVIAASLEDVDTGLFEMLRGLRREVAAERNLPPYVVFDDRTLAQLALVRPASNAAMLQVYGVGPRKITSYGEVFLNAIKNYAANNGLATDVGVSRSRVVITELEDGDTSATVHSWDYDESDDFLQRRRPLRIAARAQAFTLFHQGRSIEEISETIQRAQSTVYSYLADFIRDEVRLEALPWIDVTTFERIERAADTVGTERIKPLLAHFQGEVPYELIRVVLVCLHNRKGPGGIQPKA